MKNASYMLAVLFGACAGLALIAIEASVVRKAAIVLPYVLLTVAAIIYLRSVAAETKRSFGFALAAFMTATLFLYIYVGIAARAAGAVHSLWGRTWPMLIMLGIGCAVSTVVASAAALRASHRL